MQFQTNVILAQEDADWLDEQALAFRKNNRKPLSRSALLRAVLQGARLAQLNPASCRSEHQIARGISDLLGRGRQQRQNNGRSGMPRQ
jgi:hypothetical protein